MTTPTMADNTTSSNLANNTSGVGHGPLSGASPSNQMNTKEIVEIICFGILALLVFANLLMIGAFHVNRRLRTRTNLLLMSFAVADMIGSISVPLWVYICITSAENGPVYKVHLMFDVICGSSILSMTAVSLERYYALRSPIKHCNISKIKVCQNLLAFYM